jgi:hypothetical protein
VRVFAGFPGFYPGLVELALQAGIAERGTEPGEAFAEPPNGGARCERLSAFLWSGRGRCGARGRDAAQQELRPPGCAFWQNFEAIGLAPRAAECRAIRGLIAGGHQQVMRPESAKDHSVRSPSQNANLEKSGCVVCCSTLFPARIGGVVGLTFLREQE